MTYKVVKSWGKYWIRVYNRGEECNLMENGRYCVFDSEMGAHEWFEKKCEEES